MNIEYYRDLLRSNQITPATIERKIKEVETALDDAKFFNKSAEQIGQLESYITDLKQILAEDYSQAVVRGLEPPSAIPTPKINFVPIILPTQLFDGTQLSKEEAQEVVRLLKMVQDGKLTKPTILEFIYAINNQLPTLGRNDPKIQELLMRKQILYHIMMTVFKTQKRRRY